MYLYLTPEGRYAPLNYDANDVNRSSKAIIRNADGHILILKDNGTDWWDLPGGHLSKKDKSVLAGLQREVQEETGLVITKAEYRGSRTLTLGDTTRPVDFFEAEAQGEVEISGEHTGYKWCPPEEIGKFNMGAFKEPLEELINGR